MAKYPLPPDELFTVEDMPKGSLGLKVDIDTEAIKTWQSPNLPLPAERKKEFASLASSYTQDYLVAVYRDLFHRKPDFKRKGELIKEIAGALCFSGLEQFNQWFRTLHPLAQVILARIVFEESIPVETLEKEYGISLTEKIKLNSWTTVMVFRKELRLNFLFVYECYGHRVAGIPYAVRWLLAFWFAPPPEVLLDNCLADEQQPPAGARLWDNSAGITESWPLLCESLASLLERMDGQDRMKIPRGIKKRDLAQLRQSSGLPPFHFAGDFAPDSADLSARFLYMMKNGQIQRPKDGQKAIRSLVDAFFAEDSVYPTSYHCPDRSNLEFNLLIDHLTRTSGYFYAEDRALPPSRMLFRKMLQNIAADGRRFDADKLIRRIRFMGAPFHFIGPDMEETLKWKGKSLTLGGIKFEQQYYDEFRPDGILRYELLMKPLFKAYCFLFACLGLLEITQEEPPLPGVSRDKACPVSPYDSLKTIKITELGLWCLALRDKPPKLPERKYEAIADKELFLVTVRGESLERKVYLDRIGRKLGEDRWRISPASFLADCINKKDIENRIERFLALIDPNPAPHWISLFEKLRSRAGLFDTPEGDYLVFSLPDNQALTEELLSDRELVSVVLRAEGRLLIVPAKNEKKFYTLLGEHGIARF